MWLNKNLTIVVDIVWVSRVTLVSRGSPKENLAIFKKI